MPFETTTACPIPLQDYPHVLMAHGGGGRLMRQLIDRMFLAAFGANPDEQHDAARLNLPHGRIAVTTDSYVVTPLFFPGGDIGCMSVYGTVNDLAMAGAKPLYLTVGFILEEGLSMEVLWRVVQSMQVAAERTGVSIVAGDTKVVERGKGDGIYINTAGVGIVEHDLAIAPKSVQPGDVILLSGDIGRHGMAILAQREGLEFETTLESDVAPIWGQVLALLEGGVELHCLRDLTRGGLAAALNEISAAAGLSIQLEDTIPVSETVRGACEVLGLDPLYLANEGRFVAFVPAIDAEKAFEILQNTTPSFVESPSAQIVGVVECSEADSQVNLADGLVKLQGSMGGNRIIDRRSGELLPRIC
ncbi:MAG: hydrogenase expression/formation protein HypE [Synechococcus sp.]